jgi:hypothetical protein
MFEGRSFSGGGSAHVQAVASVALRVRQTKEDRRMTDYASEVSAWSFGTI